MILEGNPTKYISFSRRKNNLEKTNNHPFKYSIGLLQALPIDYVDRIVLLTILML